MANEERIPNRCKWGFGSEIGLNDVMNDKNRLIRHYISFMCRKVSKMFKWEGLPDTIPSFELERLLQFNGFAVISKVTGNVLHGKEGIYAFYGGLSGLLDVYQKPTQAVVNSPYLGYNKVLNIKTPYNKPYDDFGDCIVIKNDLNYEGLYLLYEKYATLLAEADLTFNVLLKQSRVPYILYAENSDVKTALDDYLKSIENGKLGYVLGTRIKHMEAGEAPQIDTKQYSSTSSAELIKANIELRQYILAQFYREIGLKDAFNMKRESLSDGEIKLGEDTLYPLVDEMQEMRKLGAEEANRFFGQSWSCGFQSVWQNNQEEQEILLETLKNEAQQEDGNPSDQEEKEPETEIEEEVKKDD